MPVSIGNSTAGRFRLKSSINQPLAQLSTIQRSLLFAECAMIAYLPVPECRDYALQMGFSATTSLVQGSTCAIWFQSHLDSVVVIHREKEPAFLASLMSDTTSPTTMADTVGQVHQEFKEEVDEFWPEIENTLERNEKPLWFAGHSSGGAIANLCASRCIVSRIQSEPEELQTFGSPRVGNKTYANSLAFRNIRWVNHNDIVPRTPPLRLGYQHSGKEMFVNQYGQIQHPNIWKRSTALARDFAQSMSRSQPVPLVNHSIANYVEVIFNLLRAQGSQPASKQLTTPSPISSA